MPDDRGLQPPESLGLETAEATQLAQASERIGHAETVNGDVTVVHLDGSSETLTSGEAIFLGDQVVTGPGGEVGIVFADESVMALGPESDLIIDEMVYDPDQQAGSMLLNVSEGVFSFVSGAIAKTDPDALSIQTPSVVIGIRGTSLLMDIVPQGAPSSITLVDDPDGTVGEAVLQNAGGVQVISEVGQTVRPSSFFEAPPPEIVPTEQLNELYAGATNALPPAFRPPSLGPAPSQDGPPPGDEGGGDGPQENAPAEDAAAGEDAPTEEEIAEEEVLEEEIIEEEVLVEEELTPEEIAALEEQLAAEEATAAEEAIAEDEEALEGEEGLQPAQDGAPEDSAEGDETAFQQALAEEGVFDGDQEAAAAAEDAFNQTIDDGASLDEATQAALDVGAETFQSPQDQPEVGTESLEDTGVINEMTTSFDANDNNIFSDPVGDSDFGTQDVSFDAGTSSDPTGSFSGGDDGGDTGGFDSGGDDGFGGDGSGDSTETQIVTAPPTTEE